MSSNTPSPVSFGLQTGQPAPSPTPPLLPAFLVTGLLLGAIVFIIVWRHFIERRNLEQEEQDPTWPADGLGGSTSNAKGPKPKLWDLEVMNENAQATWPNIMPLSAAPLRAKAKPLQPRYLVPSDEPVSFFTRMFGGERRPPQPRLPPISALAPSYARSSVLIREDEEEDDPIDRIQVSVLISLPHQRPIRRLSYYSEDKEENPNTPPLPPENLPSQDVGDSDDPGSFNGTSSPHKGKKRSLETPPIRYDPEAYIDYDEEHGLLEVAFGTIVLPYSEEC